MNSTLVAGTSNDVSPTPSSSANVTSKSNSSTNVTSSTVASVMGFLIFIGLRYFYRYNPRDDYHWEFHSEVFSSDTLNDVDDNAREETQLTVDQVDQLFPISKYNVWKANQKGSLDKTSATSAVVSPTSSGAAIPTTNESQSLRFEPPSYSTAMSGLPSSNQLDSRLSTNTTEISETLALSSDQSNLFGSFDSQEKVGSELPSMRNISKTSKDNCAICIEVFDDNDDVRGLACNHCFHQKCIDPWLTNCRGACPLCKIDYYPLDEDENPPPSSAHDRRPPQRTSDSPSYLSDQSFRDPTTPRIRSPPLAFALNTTLESGRRSRWISTPPHFRGERRLENSERSPSRLEQGEL